MTVDPWSAIRLSLLVAASASTLSLVPALLLGYLFARHSFPGKTLLSGLLMAPLVLPPVVTGLLLLHLFSRTQPLGNALEQLGFPLTFSLTGAIVAALVVGFPLHFSTIRAAFEAIDPRYEWMARSLGTRPFATFTRITLPLALPGIAAGTALAFARALGEFGATAVLAGNMEGKTRTISLAVYTLLESPSGDAAARILIAASLLLSLTALGLAETLNRWQRRRLELDEARPHG
jgi:molybdate transport system permease protein